jgi:hypothetical protein
VVQLFMHKHLLAVGVRPCGHASRPAGAAQGARTFLKPAPQGGSIESLQGLQISVHGTLSQATRKKRMLTECSLCSHSNSGSCISQVNQLIAIRHRTETMSGHNHGKFTRKTAQCLEQFRFGSHVQRAGCFVQNQH